MKRSTFLRNSLAVLTPTVISGNPIHILNNHSMVEPEVLANVNNDRVLVIIQLNGGNDGLNTVLPIDQYGAYRNARTNIAIPENKILGLNGFDETGLHPSMTAMQRLFNDGQLDIVADTEVQIAATTVDINGAVDISGNLDVGGNLVVTGTTTFNGGTLTLGDAASDNVVFGAEIANCCKVTSIWKNNAKVFKHWLQDKACN